MCPYSRSRLGRPGGSAAQPSDVTIPAPRSVPPTARNLPTRVISRRSRTRRYATTATAPCHEAHPAPAHEPCQAPALGAAVLLACWRGGCYIPAVELLQHGCPSHIVVAAWSGHPCRTTWYERDGSDASPLALPRGGPSRPTSQTAGSPDRTHVTSPWFGAAPAAMSWSGTSQAASSWSGTSQAAMLC